MKLLSVLSLLVLICGLSIGETTTTKSLLDACNTCNQAVSSLQQALKTETNPEVILDKLDNICSVVSQFIPKEQCVAFIRVYGRVILDQIKSTTSAVTPEYLCQDVLQFCSPSNGYNPEEPFYLPLIPVSSDEFQVNWRVSESQFADRSVFYYKVLVTDVFTKPGNPIIQVDFVEVARTTISVKVDQADEGTQISGSCEEDEVPCLLSFPVNTNNVWYYFTVQTNYAFESEPRFTMEIANLLTPDPILIGGHHRRLHPHALYASSILFILSAIACLCCCGCCLRKQERKKQELKKRQQQQQQEQEQQQHAFVELAPFPGIENNPEIPAGYFYYPAQNMMYVPEGYLPMHPVPAAPPATQENLH